MKAKESTQEEKGFFVDYKSALRGEYKKPENYYDQAVHIGKFWLDFIGWWLSLSVFLTSAMMIAIFYFMDFTDYPDLNILDVQKLIKTVIYYCFMVGSVGTIFHYCTKFRNIFHDRAEDKVLRFQACQREVDRENIAIDHRLRVMA